jgi:UDP-N-acetylglucosamine/UDP-N-acetylgalactosamine 4-epimerase
MNVLITGGAGFIGSNLAESLLADERVSLVRVIDNFATGAENNISSFRSHPKFEFVEADIRDYDACLRFCEGIQAISHQAALGSVPRSVKDPLTTNAVNITGTLNVFTAAKEQGVKRIVFAASSSTYGDHPGLPKVEELIGKPLSPYAVTKYVNELYASVYASLFGLDYVALRYFNIFGPRQNPRGPYAAVIPLFAESVIKGEAPLINGDGTTSRDFTFVDNAVLANKLALFTENSQALNTVYNIACGEQTSLLELFDFLAAEAGSDLKPLHGPERTGDVKHSLADISKAQQLLGYNPSVTVKEGLKKTLEWYRLQENNK